MNQNLLEISVTMNMDFQNNGKYIEKITKYIDYNDPTIIYKEQIEPYVYPAIKIASKIEL